MELLHTDRVPAAIGPYSQAIKANGLIYTSGQIPLTAEGELVQGDIKVQTRQVLENLRKLLEDCKSGMDKVIKVTIFLDNMDDFGIVNVLYAEAFGEHKPVRSTVAVKTLPKNVLVEMDVIALPYDYQ
ncbi:deaminase [Malaciobacter molluscorum LMG 25693]|uniref:Deaminase n=1 Tax=Malaciobacter molluscorum LMG 25693 TaxID=870501 RepID=A0A2G1DHT0_9BACT|nr:RidA family protein [Malaciobacter molluscorum]AXX92984.1 reactive intermediate/imine deaminase [Malaciobacter molluscorum LMG 25693]PHO18041.1 deaminase [Malaciobacter molluscorum LMG 25693]RXJ94902.1 deaminase [Malaciobacter molluscorum]